MAENKSGHQLNLAPNKSFSSDSGVMTVNSEGSFGALEFYDSAQTPISPSSTFSVSSLGKIEYSFVDAFLLCQWDNILGPRLEHVWYIAKCPEPHTSILRFVTSQVLGGEICRDINSCQVDFKFFDIPDKGIIVPAFIFSAQSNSGLSLQALALVIPNSELTLYLHQVTLIHSWMARIVAKFRVIREKRDFGTSGLADLSSWLRSFMDMLSSLQTVGLPPIIDLSYTAFCQANTLKQDFLRRMITSHLSTFGRSVVTGKQADRVNILVYTLGLFCWDSERLCSRAALSGRKWPYYQDLYVQGCMKNDDDCQVPVREMLCSQYPTTIIDVENRTVYQSSPLADHRRLSHEALVEELEELYMGHEGHGNGTEGLYWNASLPESLVKDLVEEIVKLPAKNGIREAYIFHFLHSLQRRALCLIKYLQGDRPLTCAQNRSSIKKIRHELGLQLEGDFRIVMATAEKLKPGLYQYILGERKYDSEYLPNMADVL